MNTIEEVDEWNKKVIISVTLYRVLMYSLIISTILFSLITNYISMDIMIVLVGGVLMWPSILFFLSYYTEDHTIISKIFSLSRGIRLVRDNEQYGIKIIKGKYITSLITFRNRYDTVNNDRYLFYKGIDKVTVKEDELFGLFDLVEIEVGNEKIEHIAWDSRSIRTKLLMVNI